jgi:peptidyl-tRNA hydrolase
MSFPKQVIVVRRDLRNTNGLKVRSAKVGAQIGHAAMMWLSKRVKEMKDIHRTESAEDASCWYDNRDGSVIIHNDLRFSRAEADWLLDGSFTKIVLGCDSYDEMADLRDKALRAGLTCEMVVDNGKTEFGGVLTPTCIAIGPDYPEKIDAITGHLKSL